MPKPLHDIRDGGAFDDLDVARCYRDRPPYALALYEQLLSLVAHREFAVDVGCGPGKIARRLAPHFRTVVALDPSAPMLEVGQELDDGKSSNIRWTRSRAEDAEFDSPCDLITIGTAVSWLQFEIAFPKFVEWLHPRGLVAIVSGDDVFEAPWDTAWQQFLTRWLARLGRRYDKAGFAAVGLAYTPWIDMEGNQDFVFDFEQSVQDFISCQHSRATWARSGMGQELSRAFDRDLHETLAPFARDGSLRYRVRSTLVWGRPRTSELRHS